jgi:hypothetical protein
LSPSHGGLRVLGSLAASVRARPAQAHKMMLQLSREHADNPLLKKVNSTACIIGIERSNCISRPID